MERPQLHIDDFIRDVVAPRLSHPDFPELNKRRGDLAQYLFSGEILGVEQVAKRFVLGEEMTLDDGARHFLKRQYKMDGVAEGDRSAEILLGREETVIMQELRNWAQDNGVEVAAEARAR